MTSSTHEFPNVVEVAYVNSGFDIFKFNFWRIFSHENLIEFFQGVLVKGFFKEVLSRDLVGRFV